MISKMIGKETIQYLRGAAFVKNAGIQITAEAIYKISPIETLDESIALPKITLPNSSVVIASRPDFSSNNCSLISADRLDLPEK